MVKIIAILLNLIFLGFLIYSFTISPVIKGTEEWLIFILVFGTPAISLIVLLGDRIRKFKEQKRLVQILIILLILGFILFGYFIFKSAESSDYETGEPYSLKNLKSPAMGFFLLDFYLKRGQTKSRKVGY